MSTNNTTIKTVKRDGRLYRELADGRLEPVLVPASQPKSEADVQAGALADPDNPPSQTMPLDD